MAITNKRKMVRVAGLYFSDQLDDLDIIAAVKGISRADLLRQGAAYIIGISEHQDIIHEHKKRNNA